MIEIGIGNWIGIWRLRLEVTVGGRWLVYLVGWLAGGLGSGRVWEVMGGIWEGLREGLGGCGKHFGGSKVENVWFFLCFPCISLYFL